MTHKVYPNHLPRVKNETSLCWEQVYRGCAQALLTQEEVEAVLSALECAYQNDVPESVAARLEKIDGDLRGIIHNGVQRMHKLHGVLGAFDSTSAISVTKADSEVVLGCSKKEVSLSENPSFSSVEDLPPT